MMEVITRLRSVLYLPASNPRAIAKARTLPCDAVVLDLEDAVAPEQKHAARDAAVATVREGGFGDRTVVVRINGLDAAECAQGPILGFDGKTLIHPGQIDAANAAFAPSAEELAWARSVVAAFALPENVDKGAVRLSGAMVERPHLVEAERVLAAI